MSGLKLFAFGWPVNMMAWKILAAAKMAQVPVDFEDLEFGGAHLSEEFKNNCHPMGSMPVLQTPEGFVFESNAILRYIARANPAGANLYGKTNYDQAQVDMWLDYAATELQSPAMHFCGKAASKSPASDADKTKLEQADAAIAGVDRWLQVRTFVAGERVTVADLAVVAAMDWILRFSGSDFSKYKNALRLYNSVITLPEFVAVLVERKAPLSLKAAAPAKGAAADKKDGAKKAAAEEEQEDKLVLNNAEQGKVVTRFPPEASGLIHIGHAKAALVNSMLRTKYNGKMIFRFDDTNPDKENHEFEKAIVKDLQEGLGIKWDQGPTYSSDYFDLMLKYCDQMLEKGQAYCDTADAETMQRLRKECKPTPCRDNSIERNLELWAEMKKGSALGLTCCVRAKISVDDNNGAMRDPTIYRTKVAPHPRHGDKYNVYPTYDFCCPIVDSVEGVTHALRTTEYRDRNAQYYWFCDTLGIRKPLLEDFSRLNMEYSLMSKRKLTRCVDELKVVDGWDDPRFPTVRALLRRGLKIEALMRFVEVQGMSKAINFMEWSKLWNFNNQILDPSVPRYSAASKDHGVVCKIIGEGAPAEGKPEPVQRLRHKKNEALGEKTYYKTSTVILDAEDVLLLKPDEEVTLMDWGNVFVRNVVVGKDGYPVSADLELNPKGEIKKTKWKLSWVPQMEGTVPLVLNEYDQLLAKKKPEDGDKLEDILAKNTHLVQNAVGEKAMSELKKGDFFQLERRGYYILDKKLDDGSLSLIAIPDGKDKLNHLSAKAQFYKDHPDQAPKAPAAAEKKAAAPKDGASQSLEEKRAAKAAKKAAQKAVNEKK